VVYRGARYLVVLGPYLASFEMHVNEAPTTTPTRTRMMMITGIPLLFVGSFFIIWFKWGCDY